MSLNRFSLLFPGRRALFTTVFSAIVGAALAVGVSSRVASPPKMAAGPPSDARFVALGKAYLPQLGKAYADAWTEGAAQLEAGKSVSASLDAVAKTWATNRTQLYAQVFTSEFTKILPESIADADVTPAERAALAAAWRGLSVGLAP